MIVNEALIAFAMKHLKKLLFLTFRGELNKTSLEMIQQAGFIFIKFRIKYDRFHIQ